MTTALLFVALAQGLLTNTPSLDLKPMPSGVFKRLGGYLPLAIHLTDARPEAVKNAPEGTLRYGFLDFGTHHVLVATTGERLYVDSNGDGDLTNDPAPQWSLRPATARGKAYREGTFQINLSVQGQTLPCDFGVYETDNANLLGAYADFALAGKIQLGGKSYDALYSDPSATWDGTKGVLMIDKDGDGKFHPGYEFYEAGKPFNVAGTTYELLSQQGRATVVTSAKTVEERTLANSAPADPNLANGLVAGKRVLPFTAQTMSGKNISFPDSYKGKIVLVDFWATWCGPCMREMPNVVKAYNAFHNKNFEVLGVSLDSEEATKQIQTVIAKQGMKWEQVYDGKGFDARLAKQYSIKAIPATYLVDGDTGTILAVGDGARGEKLAAAIEKALAAKK